ncbi:anaphase-promoting complex subunit 4-like [Gordionus sp. m RMFG-2023]|uniref:anaphase-promoting complex subunit 4-like n=1 Tax=Gordionus sp. m RMFG-2023 TaxID=3053472 RepID=UPI0031FC1474
MLPYDCIDDKKFTSKILFLEWNPIMDIAALANSENEVFTQRLYSQKHIWLHKPPKKSSKIVNIKWRPDGKILSVGYHNQHLVQFLTVGNGINIYTLNIHDDIEYFNWKCYMGNYFNTFQEINVLNENEFLEETVNFFPTLATIKNNFPPGFLINRKDETPLHDHSSQENMFINYHHTISNIFGDDKLVLFHVHTIRDNQPQIRVYAYGLFLLLTIDFPMEIKKVFFPEWSSDMKYMFIQCLTANDPFDTENIVIVTSNLFNEFNEEIVKLSHLLFDQNGLFAVIGLMGDVIYTIRDVWESYVLDINAKLEPLFNQEPTCNVYEDLLELIFMGIGDDRLKHYFEKQLTFKEISDILELLEYNYSKILNLLQVLDTTCYILSQNIGVIKGASLNVERYYPFFTGKKPLGSDDLIDTTNNFAQAFIEDLGGFKMKIMEMRKVLTKNVQGYRTLFSIMITIISELQGIDNDNKNISLLNNNCYQGNLEKCIEDMHDFFFEQNMPEEKGIKDIFATFFNENSNYKFEKKSQNKEKWENIVRSLSIDCPYITLPNDKKPFLTLYSSFIDHFTNILLTIETNFTDTYKHGKTRHDIIINPLLKEKPNLNISDIGYDSLKLIKKFKAEKLFINRTGDIVCLLSIEHKRMQIYEQ